MTGDRRLPGPRLGRPWRLTLAALSLTALLVRVVGFWRLRLAVGRVLALLPDEDVPDHVRVLPPPADEYVGTLSTTPAETRERLPEKGSQS